MQITDLRKDAEKVAIMGVTGESITSKLRATDLARTRTYIGST